MRVCLSYLAADVSFVSKITSALETAENKVISLPGLHEMERAQLISVCDVLVWLMSTEALHDTAMQQDWRAAVQSATPILPLQLEDTDQFDLSWLIYFGQPALMDADQPSVAAVTAVVSVPAKAVSLPVTPPMQRSFPWRAVFAVLGVVLVGGVLALVAQNGLLFGPPGSTLTLSLSPAPRATLTPSETFTLTPTLSPTATFTPTITHTPLPTNTPTPQGAFATERPGLVAASGISDLSQRLAQGNISFVIAQEPIRLRDDAQRLSGIYNAGVVVWGSENAGELTLWIRQDRQPNARILYPLDVEVVPAEDDLYLLPYLQGLLAYVRRDHVVAVTAFSQAQRLLPTDKTLRGQSLFHLYHGNVLLRSGDTDGAIIAYNQAITLDESNSLLYFNRALARLQRQEYDLAIADFGSALNLGYEAAELYLGRGNAYLGLQQYPQALSDYERALTLVPDYPSVFVNRGVLYGQQQQYDKALADFNRALELDPDFAAAYSNRGQVYRNVQQFDLALKDLDQAVLLDATNADTYVTRGAVYANLRQYETALVNYNRAVTLRPNDPSLYYTRGIARLITNDTAGAEVDFQQTLQLDPTFADAYAGLGGVAQARGDLEAARLNYQRHLDLAGDDALPFVVETLKQLPTPSPSLTPTEGS